MRMDAMARGVAAALGTAMLLAAAPVKAPSLAALARIEPGLWQVKTTGSDAPPRALCVADPSVLLHYGRNSASCERSVVIDRADTATVQYRCPGGGTGRTTIRVATPRAFDLDLQGLAGGLPYDESYEAHRLGACSGAAR